MIAMLTALLAATAPVQQIGTVRFATSCSSTAQPLFTRAVALLHSFAYAQATEGFNAALAADPRCAMAWWGLAIAAWGNPFAAGIKPAAQIQRGLAAVQSARALGAPSDRESRYIEAAARLYERDDSLPQRARLLAWRDGMAELVAREPADTEAAIFHALALAVAADPADKTYAAQLEAGATLDRLVTALPDHPGLAHYIIHTYDVPPLAGRALGAAKSYSHIAPALSHALHMPSHTFTRVGAWRQSIDANIAAGDAARRENSVAEELHSADYRVYAYLQTGQEKAALRILDSLPAIAARFDPNFVGSAAPPSAGYFALAAIPARYALERGAWAEAARLEFHPGPTPFANAVTWFARAIGAARTGDSALARSAVDSLDAIRQRLVKAGETYWSEQIGIQQQAAAAWLDFAGGRRDQALAGMRAAADREDATEKNAITPGPLAPARELLGEMLLEAGRPRDALAAFETTLKHEPNRKRTLAGAAQARKLLDKPPRAP